MTEQQAERFAREWYAMVDSHAPVTRLLSRTAEDLEVSFPGRVLDREAYFQWYIQDIHSNFNGKHTIHKLSSAIFPDRAAVYMEITWTAEQWIPPAARSEPLCLKPNVTLTLIPDGKDGLLLWRYHVEDRVE